MAQTLFLSCRPYSSTTGRRFIFRTFGLLIDQMPSCHNLAC